MSIGRCGRVLDCIWFLILILFVLSYFLEAMNSISVYC